MRTTFLFLTSLLTLSVFAASPVRVDGDVKVVTSQNSVRSNGGVGANRVSDERAHLEFKVRNVTEAEEKIEVRWWLFARGIGSTSGALRVAEGGSKEMTVAPRQVADFKSGSHTFHRQEANPQAFLPGRKMSLAGQQRFGKHTEGVKFAGYGVQLIRAGQVLDSQFTADDLAAHVGASAKTPGKVASGGGKK